MSIEQALTSFAGVVGDQWVSVSEDDRELYTDAYSPAEENEFIASGFVAPANVEEVQAIVRIANENRVPLWPVSTGRNLAYGGAAPRTRDTMILDLKRMNRVIEVNEELAYAVVEPGVSFFDLYEYLREHDHKLWLSVPGPGWGSVIGNALERGAGYGRDSDHFATTVGMEVVLPDGELLRTGAGAMQDNHSWHIMRYGFGPMVDGLFSQSGMGIVTRMGRFLTPEPDGFLACDVAVANEDDIVRLIDVMRPFKLNGMIDTPVVVGNILIPASYEGQRSRWYDGEGAIPDDVLKQIQSDLGIGHWNGFFGLYGPEDQVQSRWKLIAEAIASIPGARSDARFYARGTPIDEFRDESLSGKPHLHEFTSLNWENSGAHIDFSPVVPMTGQHARRAYKLIRSTLNKHGLDYRGGLYCEGRFFRLVCTIYFDRSNAEQRQRVRTAFGELISVCADNGYGEYRTHLAYMDQVASSYDFNNNAMHKFQERLKTAIDPNGIIAPGKSGIWGAYKAQSD